MIILKDGVRYKEWIPQYEVRDFEPMVKYHVRDIFGEECEYIPKREVTTNANIKSIPDGFVVDYYRKKWYVVELKILSVDAINRIAGQIVSYKNATSKAQTRREIYKVVKQTRNAPFLDELINDSSPELVVIVSSLDGEMGKKFIETVQGTDQTVKVLEFRTYCRSFVDPKKVHIHLFSPAYEPSGSFLIDTVASGPTKPEGERQGTKSWVDYCVNALQNLGGRAELRHIYKQVKKLRDQDGERQVQHLEATVRATLEDNSRSRGKNVFEPEHLGSGIWLLKER